MKKAGLIVGLVVLPVMVACTNNAKIRTNVVASETVYSDDIENQTQIDVPVDNEGNPVSDGNEKTQSRSAFTEINYEIPLEALIGPEVEKPFEEGDQWVYLDRNILSDDTYDTQTDSAGVAEKFVHCEIGKKHDGVKYFLEYIDNNNFYITFDNSENSCGRCIELFIFDKTFPNKDGEDWSLDRVTYYIEAGETVTKQYHTDNKMKEESPVQFGIAIDDRGFNYSDDKALIYDRSKEYNLDITYYGVDHSVYYEDVNLKAVNETVPEGFNGIK